MTTLITGTAEVSMYFDRPVCESRSTMVVGAHQDDFFGSGNADVYVLHR
jgi:hypothetical protein